MNLGHLILAMIFSNPHPRPDIQKRDYIALCPLAILPRWIRNNAYLDEDPTRLNYMVPPEKALPSSGWDRLSPGVKEKKTAMGKTWIYINNFVFRKKEGVFEDDMIIDFNYVFHINRKNLGNDNEKLIPYRILHLTREARASLREKLVAYYHRNPDSGECNIYLFSEDVPPTSTIPQAVGRI